MFFFRGVRFLIVLVVFFITLVPLLHSAENVVVSSAVPVAHVVAAVYDFGKVEAGSIVEHDFIIENRGKSPLLIKNVRSSCGCTVGKVGSSEIVSGASAPIHVRFDTKGRVGKQQKSVFVTTNDPNSPHLVCRLTGILSKPPLAGKTIGEKKDSARRGRRKSSIAKASAKAIPRKVAAVAGSSPLVVAQAVWNAGRVRRGVRLEHDFEVVNSGQADLSIASLRSSCNCAIVRAVPVTLAAGGKGKIRVVFDAKGKRGRQNVKIAVGDSAGGKMMLGVNAEVESAIVAEPSAVYFMNAKKGNVEKRKVRIVDRDGGGVKVTSLRCSRSFLGADVHAIEGRENAVEIIVTLAADAPVGRFRGVVVVRTNDPLDPERKILVAGIVSGGILLSRDRVFLRVGKEKSARITLSSTGDDFRIEEFVSMNGRFGVRQEVVSKGRKYSFVITPAGETTSLIRDFLLIKTDVPDQAEIKIPVLVQSQRKVR